MLHGCLVLFATLVFEDLQVYKEIFVFKLLHDDIVCCQAMFVFLRCKSFKQNDIRRVIRYYDVLVAASCLGGKPLGVVHVEFSLVQYFYMQLVHRVIYRWWLLHVRPFIASRFGAIACSGELLFELLFYNVSFGLFDFGGADVLAVLYHVFFDGFIRGGAVPASIVVCQSWPGFKISSLDRREPGKAHGVASGRMEVLDQCFDGW